MRYNPPYVVEYANGVTHRYHRLIERSEDGTLFSKGHYPTKITADMLPEYYMKARVHKLWGFVRTKGVVGLHYRPNTWVNHLFRDDILFVSFTHEMPDSEDFDTLWGSGYDFVLDGPFLVSFLAMAKRWSPECVQLDAAIQAMFDKVKLYQQTHPDEGDCMSDEEFAQLWERECRKANA